MKKTITSFLFIFRMFIEKFLLSFQIFLFNWFHVDFDVWIRRIYCVGVTFLGIFLVLFGIMVMKGAFNSPDQFSTVAIFIVGLFVVTSSILFVIRFMPKKPTPDYYS